MKTVFTIIVLSIIIVISVIILLWFFLYLPKPYIVIFTDPIAMNCNLTFHEGDFSKYQILERAIREEIDHPNIHAIYDISIFESQNYEQFLEEQFDLDPTSGGMMGNTLCFNYVSENEISHRLAIEMGDKTRAVDLLG